MFYSADRQSYAVHRQEIHPQPLIGVFQAFRTYISVQDSALHCTPEHPVKTEHHIIGNQNHGTGEKWKATEAEQKLPEFWKHGCLLL